MTNEPKLIQYYVYVSDESEVIFATKEPKDQNIIFCPKMLRSEMNEMRKVMQLIADEAISNCILDVEFVDDDPPETDEVGKTDKKLLN